jgi:hypothetical protein
MLLGVRGNPERNDKSDYDYDNDNESGNSAEGILGWACSAYS